MILERRAHQTRIKRMPSDRNGQKIAPQALKNYPLSSGDILKSVPDFPDVRPSERVNSVRKGRALIGQKAVAAALWNC